MTLLVRSNVLFLSFNGKSLKMKVTERLKLMHQIAKKLAGDEWTIINLTLEQFHLPVTKTTRLDPASYILKQIRKAQDDILVDLAHHLEIPLAKTALNGTPVFWKENNLRLFISHLAIKKETATALRDELQPCGISAFVAHSDITPSKEWQQEIEIALHTCDGLVALMEEGFHKSFWTDHEVGFVFGRGMPVIPVNMGESPYGFLAKFQAYKFHDIQKLAETIFKVLINDARTTHKMSVALIHQFERSGSFASAGQNLRLLRKIRYWDNSLIERLKLAVRKNDQIKGSFDVPEGVARLLKKVKSELK
jgi:hypothetical protein